LVLLVLVLRFEAGGPRAAEHGLGDAPDLVRPRVALLVDEVDEARVELEEGDGRAPLAAIDQGISSLSLHILFCMDHHYTKTNGSDESDSANQCQ
jgi:hypothetical protein